MHKPQNDNGLMPRLTRLPRQKLMIIRKVTEYFLSIFRLLNINVSPLQAYQYCSFSEGKSPERTSRT